MSPKRFLPLAVVALLLAPTLAMLPVAAAQDTVPTAPSVKFETVPGVPVRFYAAFADTSQGSGQPNCGAPRLDVQPATETLDSRNECPYTTATGTTQVPTGSLSTVSFPIVTDYRPIRAINVSGNSSIAYHHGGTIGAGVTVDVVLRSGTNPIATGRLTSGQTDTVLALTGQSGTTSGRVQLASGQPFSIQLTGSTTGTGQLPGTGALWTVDDTNTYVEIRAEDAYRAALWTADEKSAVRDVFTPIPAGTTPAPDRRIVGFYALQSAYGYTDATQVTPRFSVLLNGQAREIGAGGATFLNGALNSTASVASSGLAVWTTPPGAISYVGFPGGEYTLHNEATVRGAPLTRATDHVFQLTAQSVRLAPFQDARVPSLVETQAHGVAPGGTTTYLLQVNNTGSANDTFTLNLTAPNAPAGWSATLGGPEVAGRSVRVPAGEARIVTVTVTAPFNAAASDRIIHLVNATSTLDPGARSADITLVTTVSTTVTRELGIIVQRSNLALVPGEATDIPVYVWNRGTRAANASLEVKENTARGWTSDLVQGSSGVDRIVLSNIPAGAIAETTLRVTGPLNQASRTHDVTLNATSLDANGVAVERLLAFTLSTLPGVELKVFDTIGGRPHRVELGAGGGGGGANPLGGGGGGLADGVDATWFRVWITNTGRATESFDLSIDSVAITPDTCTNTFTDIVPNDGDGFAFYFRDASGLPQRISQIPDLGASRTAEVYVLVPVAPAGTCSGQKLTFVAQAKGATTGVIARGAATVTAEATTTNGVSVVSLEAIARDPAYAAGAPLVEIGNAERRSVTGAVEVGKNVSYFLRVTNAASYKQWTANGITQDPTVHVVVEGIDRESGWNVSLRPVNVAAENDFARNPLRADYNLSNVNPRASNRVEAWIDREIEVVVQAPDVENGTGLAGAQDQIQVRAFINGSNDASTLEIKSVITEFANITVRPEASRILAHPGEAGAFLVHVTNVGSSTATVTLRAAINGESTPNAAAWRVDPTSQSFPLPAFKSRTVAISATPPGGAAQGSTGEVNLTVEYARNPSNPTATTNITQRLISEIVAPGTLQLTAGAQEATIAPGGFANYTMTLRNTGGLEIPYVLNATSIPNWTITASPSSGRIGPGQSVPVVLVLKAPDDVTNDSRFATVVNVQEVGNGNNFDTLAFTANILGGKPVPSISVPVLAKRVDRAGTTSFEVAVRNLGSAAGRLPLEVRTMDATWSASVRNARNENITFIDLAPNQLATVNVTVSAPLNVPERTVNTVEVVAYSPDQTQASRAALQAEIHDYGVDIEVVPAARDGLPGIPSEVTLRVKNTGNDNDTLNVSADLRELPDWTVQLSQDEIRLEPGATGEIRATIRSPTSPLPTARTYTFPFWVGTRGGQDVSIPKNDTASATLSIPSYRAFDADRDEALEVAVDLDKRADNGFEAFREVFTDGLQSQVVAMAPLNGKARFFLDVPRDRPYDGIADVWFDPEGLFAYAIESTPDLSQDGTPDYLIDTDHDGKIDMAYDTVTDRYSNAVEIKAFGDDRVQYLVDTNADGKPDRYFDPEANLVTKTTAQSGDRVGIDTDNDGRADKYYDTQAKSVSDATVSNLGDFARDYWYFFVAFLALVVLTVVVIVVRRRRS